MAISWMCDWWMCVIVLVQLQPCFLIVSIKYLMGDFTHFLLLLCLSSALAAHTYRKVVVTDSDALCLDGTKGAYYIVDGKEPTKFMISFEGGGWCGSSAGLDQTLANCLTRAGTALGSSSSYEPTITWTSGILSDVADNPFKDWTIAHLKYCDGTGHQGYRKEAISYKGTPLHFRGHNVTTAQLNSIQQSHQLFSKATEIVVTGQSAGGLATFLWTNYIADRAPNAKVWSLPDSGIFLDSSDYNTKQHSYRMLFQNFMKISNEEVDPPTAECVAANPTEKWKCMFAEYISDYIKVPLFAIESMYDSWSIHYILGIACQANASFEKCDAPSRTYIEQYHTNTSLVLHRIAERKGNGYWAPSCCQHVYSTASSFNSASFRIPSSSTHSLALSVTEWVTGKAVSYIHQDEGDWPINKPCSGLPANSLQQQ